MSPTQPFAILGAVDDSDQARLVLEHVADEAARHDAAEVHVLRVIDVRPKDADRVPIEDERAALLAELKDVLDTFFAANATSRIHLHVRIGRPDEEIVGLAHEARARMIVIGRHGEGAHRRRVAGPGVHLRHHFAGNTVERVLRTAPCGVLVVQDPMYDEATTDQCADCVRVRADSAGETWFCEAHLDDYLFHSLVPYGGSATHSVGFGSGGVF